MVVLAIVAPLVATCPDVATADAGTVSDAFATFGHGALNSGLPVTGCAYQQAVTFAGTLMLIVGDDTTSNNVNFAGSSAICETLQAGAGSGNLTGSAQGTVAYTRNGNFVNINGFVLINGEEHTILAATCDFEPTDFDTSSIYPVRTFDLVCVGVLSSS